MKKCINNNRGVTLISLSVVIIILMILSVSLTISVKSTIELKEYNSIKEDIISLTEEVKLYYLDKEQLPVHKEKSFNLADYGVPTEDINPNDNNVYYPIDITVLSNQLSLNHGNGNKNKDWNTKDLYVMNEESLTVYYLQGAVLDNKKHYTIIDDFAGGSFANDYYSKVDLPIISVVTMESSGSDKTLVTVGEKIKLKILTNYIFDKTPTILIDGQDVTNDCIWNGTVGTVEYTVTSIQDQNGNSKVGQPVEFSISNYKADNRDGETIRDVTFGTKVLFYNDK